MAGLFFLAAHGGPPDGSPEPAAYPGPLRTTAASDAGTATPREIPFFPSAANARGWQGFVRVVNPSDENGTVSIRAFDDAGRDFGTLTLAIDAGETVHFNSDDLEDGNASKGLTGSTGRPAQGDWRLRLTSTLSIEAMAYVRTADGLLTAMHDVAPMVEGAGHAYRVVTFNSGSNDSQVSLLRLVNPGAAEAAVTIRGVDDRGRHRGPRTPLDYSARGPHDLRGGPRGRRREPGRHARRRRRQVAARGRSRRAGSRHEPARQSHRAPDEPFHGSPHGPH